MGKKITILCGSPRRKGNTNLVAGWVAEAATDAGAEVEMIDLAHLKYGANGCTACMRCQTSDAFECVIDDEAAPILARLGEADVVVYATPVYFGGPTAQMKLFLDRTLSQFKMGEGADVTSHAFEDATFAVIVTAGGDMDGGLALTEATFKMCAEFVKLPFESLLVPTTPMEASELEADAALRDKAAAFGRTLAGTA